MLDNHVLQKRVLLSRGEVFFTEDTGHGGRAFGGAAVPRALGQGQRLQDAVPTIWESEKREELKPASVGKDFPPGRKGPEVLACLRTKRTGRTRSTISNGSATPREEAAKLLTLPTGCWNGELVWQGSCLTVDTGPWQQFWGPLEGSKAGR